MFLRGRYGHGGRLGYEKEWRADVSKSGGGELIDQGPHLMICLGGFSEKNSLQFKELPRPVSGKCRLMTTPF